MSISNNGYGYTNNGDMIGDLKSQEKAAYNRRVEPASPEEFLKWARQALREHRHIQESLVNEHQKLSQAGELATVGLTRLGNLVKLNERVQYEYLMDLHRDFTFKNQDIGYTLEKCKGVLDETTTNIQFVGETLVAPLADRHKKIAVQHELGLRLRDTDADFDRCKQAVEGQKKTYRQLSEGIQTLMNKASIKLPPKTKENIDREDRVAKIALTHKKSLEKGRDVINYTPYTPENKVGKVEISKTLGDAKVASTPAQPSSDVVSDKFDIKYALASTTVGLIVGILIFYVLLEK